MYSYLRERIKHAVRFRHKRGFGVHSPFMFNLILNVIRDKEKKFNYPEQAEHNRKIRLKQQKLYRLICRLVCFLNVDYVLCFSAHSGDILAYLSGSAARKEANQPRFMREAGFIYIGKDARTVLQDVVIDFLPTATVRQKCIVITDIYKNSFNARLWQQWRGKATVSVDMMWYGLLFFDEKLQKGRYNLII